MAKEVSKFAADAKPVERASDIIFRDRRFPGSDRRNRDAQADNGSFLHCRRLQDQDRRKRLGLVGDSWWLKINYVDWESGASNLQA